MKAQLAPYDSAHAARRILEAAQSGDLEGLEAELGQPLSWPEDVSSDTMERWELLDAIVAQMREALARMRRRTTDRLEGAEVHLRLLRHLAGAAPALI
jgi:hypothetical protein